MKVKKNIRKTKKSENIECMCRVHLMLNPNQPCLGHGVKCPCSDLIATKKLKEDAGEVDKKEETSIQST